MRVARPLLRARASPSRRVSSAAAAAAMAKPEYGILSIEPQNELKFEGPFGMPVASFIKLTNVTEKKVHYKLKTTAPKKYCVRPNSGVLFSKGFIEVQVVLQPFNYNAAEKHKHKFMVQFMVEPEGSSLTPEDLWKCIAPDKIMNYKLKCVFEVPSAPGNKQQELPPPENTNAPVAEEKLKRVIDNNKTGTAKTLLGNGSELQKVVAEVKQLRDEESKLLQENIALKEELTRLHQKIGKDAKRHTYTPPATQMGRFDTIGQVPVYYYGIAIVIAFLSFWLGKFNC